MKLHAVAKWCDPCIFVCKIVKFQYFYPIFSQFWSISITCPKNVFIWMENRLDHILWFDFEKEVFSKFGSFKCKSWPISAKKFYDPNHRNTLSPKQAKIVLKSVFLNKINTLSVVILWLHTFWSSKLLWPFIFLSKILYKMIIYNLIKSDFYLH